MTDLPFTFTLPTPQVIPSRVDNHIERRLSALQGQFFDQETYNKMLSAEDQLIYEVYEIKRPEVEGEILMGISIVHPGKVGNEFFMTKGHFHSILETSEVYYCMHGEGYMVMENRGGRNFRGSFISWQSALCAAALGASFRVHFQTGRFGNLLCLPCQCGPRLRHDRTSGLSKAGHGWIEWS